MYNCGMRRNYYNNLLERSRLFYKTIGSIKCRDLDNHNVHFGVSGFTHLLMKDRKFRPIKEQIRKLSLIKYIPETINASSAIIEKRVINRDVTYTSISAKIHTKEIKVIIRKYANGGYHFWSIMDK